MKEKFKRYDIKFHNHTYCILIPQNIGNLRVYNYENHEGTGWIGDRKGIKTLSYAAAVLGFSPYNKIIYFPMRNSPDPRDYRYKDFVSEEMCSGMDDCDLIFTTHQVPLKRSDWKDIRNTLKYRKSETYIFDYDEKRTVEYFTKSLRKQENSTVQRKKEYLVEIMQEHTLFQVFSRMQFQQIFLNLNEFLKGDLENQITRSILRGHFEVPFEYTSQEYAKFPFRKKKQMEFWPFVDYYDEKIVKRAERVKK